MKMNINAHEFMNDQSLQVEKSQLIHSHRPLPNILLLSTLAPRPAAAAAAPTPATTNDRAAFGSVGSQAPIKNKRDVAFVELDGGVKVRSLHNGANGAASRIPPPGSHQQTSNGTFHYFHHEPPISAPITYH